MSVKHLNDGTVVVIIEDRAFYVRIGELYAKVPSTSRDASRVRNTFQRYVQGLVDQGLGSESNIVAAARDCDDPYEFAPLPSGQRLTDPKQFADLLWKELFEAKALVEVEGDVESARMLLVYYRTTPANYGMRWPSRWSTGEIEALIAKCQAIDDAAREAEHSTP